MKKLNKKLSPSVNYSTPHTKLIPLIGDKPWGSPVKYLWRILRFLGIKKEMKNLSTNR